MSEILVTCTDCGTTLRVSGESPQGRFVRCPNCTTIFIANKLERTPPSGAAAGPKLTCPDCGAIQYSLQPIAGGKFVRCVDCATAFRVPGPPVPLSLPKPAPAVSPKTSPFAPRPSSPAPEKPTSAASRPAAARYEMTADDPTEPYNMQPVPAAARGGQASRDGDSEGGANDDLPSRQRRRRRRDKNDSARFWIPALVVGGVAVVGPLMAVLMLVILRNSKDTPLLAKDAGANVPLAMATNPQAQSNPGEGAGGQPSPNLQTQPLPNTMQPPVQYGPPGGQNPMQPPRPRMPGVPNPGPGSTQPPPSNPPNNNTPGLPNNEATPAPGDRGAPSPIPPVPDGPMRGMWPGALPGGFANRRRLERPAQPPGAQPFNTTQGRFNLWLQDFEVAKQTAARDGKEILVLFDGSDWCGWSMRLASEVLFEPSFEQQLRQAFVPVFVDFPKGAQARSRVQDPDRNKRLAEQFAVDGYPRIIVSDARGRAYGIDGYQEGGPEAYWQRLMQMRSVRDRRDELLKRVDSAQGRDKLKAAQEALKFLGDKDLVVFYDDLLAEWSALADKLDPRNTAGLAEVFFETSWTVRVVRSGAENHDALKAHIAEFAEWKKNNRFKDANRGARLHLLVAFLHIVLDDEDGAKDFSRMALDCHPTDPELLALLRKIVGSMGGSGTGFVVASGGYIMTNHHVARAGSKVFVRLPGVKEPAPADVLASDKERDIALIRLKVTGGIRLKPLPIAADRPVNRGLPVAAFGFPISSIVGTGLKLTTGVVTALPESANRDMFMLDAKINPGNSGGPVCDACGNVVGMVRAKLRPGEDNFESYGFAIPAQDLSRFLKQNLKSYKPLTQGHDKKPWDEVDRSVSPSVLMIIVKG